MSTEYQIPEIDLSIVHQKLRDRIEQLPMPKFNLPSKLSVETLNRCLTRYMLDINVDHYSTTAMKFLCHHIEETFFMDDDSVWPRRDLVNPIDEVLRLKGPQTMARNTVNSWIESAGLMVSIAGPELVKMYSEKETLKEIFATDDGIAAGVIKLLTGDVHDRETAATIANTLRKQWALQMIRGLMQKLKTFKE